MILDIHFKRWMTNCIAKALHSIGHLTTRIVEGIVIIQAERNERNNADSDLPHVLPYELVKISTGEFRNTTVDAHLQQL